MPLIFWFRVQKNKNDEVSGLLELSLAYVCNHIKRFDLEDFPDSFLLK